MINDLLVELTYTPMKEASVRIYNEDNALAPRNFKLVFEDGSFVVADITFIKAVMSDGRTFAWPA